MTKLCLLALIPACIAAQPHGQTVQALRLILPPQPDPVVEHIARVFVRQVRERSGARVVVQGEAPLSVTARPLTAYLFSRGRDGPEGTPGDDLGLSGTSALDTIPPGRLFFHNGDAAAQLIGKTELPPDTWHHIVLVRDGTRLSVYLDGNSAPEVFGDLPKGYPDGTTQFFLGGRNDNFANLQGKLAEIAVYTRALTPEEATRHHAAAESAQEQPVAQPECESSPVPAL